MSSGTCCHNFSKLPLQDDVDGYEAFAFDLAAERVYLDCTAFEPLLPRLGWGHVTESWNGDAATGVALGQVKM